MKDLSIIITAANEWPSLWFTVLNFYEELKDSGLDFEIVVVSNKITDPNDGTRNFADGKEIPNVRYLEFNDKQSHWLAKNYGIQNTNSHFLFFSDAHCIISHGGIVDMFKWITSVPTSLNAGSIHSRIRWRCSGDTELKIIKDKFSHNFVPANQSSVPYKVETASTCGMLCSRKIFDEIGMWNKNFGCRGGGEIYMIWKRILCGYSPWMHHSVYLWHPDPVRRYPYNMADIGRNQSIAAYVLGGDKWLNKVSEKENLEDQKENIKILCENDRKDLLSKQKISLDEFFDNEIKN